MASGKIPFSNDWFRVTRLSTSATISDILQFSGNNERHLLLVTGPGAGQRTIYMIGTSSLGTTWYVEIGTAGTGFTLTTGTRQLTIAHNSASMLYIDFCLNGNFLSFPKDEEEE